MATSARSVPRALVALLALLVAAVALGACGTSPGVVRGPFQGQLVDADTGRPISGAVILAIWETVSFSPTGHGGQEFFDARETVSDASGHFELPILSAPLWKLNIQPPRICPFAPGYRLLGPCIPAIAESVAYAGGWDRWFTVTPVYGQRFIDPTVVKMRQIKSKPEWCAYSISLPPLRTSMAEKMPMMMRAVRNEKRIWGLC
jgi:hypothetical protein